MNATFVAYNEDGSYSVVVQTTPSYVEPGDAVMRTLRRWLFEHNLPVGLLIASNMTYALVEEPRMQRREQDYIVRSISTTYLMPRSKYGELSSDDGFAAQVHLWLIATSKSSFSMSEKARTIMVPWVSAKICGAAFERRDGLLEND